MDELQRADEPKNKRPSLLWFGQTIGAFTGASVLGFSLLAFGVTGGVDLGGAARRSDARAGQNQNPWAQLARWDADLQDGQFYREHWLNPETSRPYSDDIDAQSVSYASADALAGDEADLEGAADEGQAYSDADHSLSDAATPFDEFMQDDPADAAPTDTVDDVHVDSIDANGDLAVTG